MRVLITGIDGFVGSHAAELLAATGGVEVHGVVRRLDQLPNIRKSTLTLHEADVTDFPRVNTLVREIRPERILHLAGQAFVPTSLQDPMKTFHANIIGGLNILESARLQLVSSGKSPAVLVVTSGEVYGRVGAHQLPATESLPLIPNTPYSASKASLDMIAQQYAVCFGVNVIIARPFNHAGPRQSPSFVVSDFGKQFAEIAAGIRKPVIRAGNISVMRDFTDARDVVRAYWKLFERTSDDFVFNVASGRGVEIREIILMLQEISGVTVTIAQDEARLRTYDVPKVVASYERLQNATGWTPQIPFRQTLQDVYDYWARELRSRADSQQ